MLELPYLFLGMTATINRLVVIQTICSSLVAGIPGVFSKGNHIPVSSFNILFFIDVICYLFWTIN